MKKTVARLLTAGLLACSAGVALADGIPSAANIAEAPIGGNEWRGFFVSASVGYGWSDSEQYADVDLGSDGILDGQFKKSFEADGVLGAIGLGYDFTVRDNVVLGVFGDYTFGDLDDKYDTPAAGVILPGSVKAKYEDIWAVGARAGVIVHKDLLLFGTVGYTAAEFSAVNEGGKGKKDLDGYFVGAGLERLLCNNLYLKAEYRYSDYGSFSETAVNDPGCGAACTTKVEFENEIHSVRVGLAYKFGARAEEAVPLK
ncbi:MAG: outer membrane beta-barrel protein [Hyphomicrobiaceae bacterium]|nr:outer membrane beta-barrel protein [Hyphomicrobiaceae bacterium]